MKSQYLLNYLDQINSLIPKYLFTSFNQDVDNIGNDTVLTLTAAGSELYLNGIIVNAAKALGGNVEDQNVLQDILEDFLVLHANMNLLILFCHRVEILNSFADTQELVPRAFLNQLNKIYGRVKHKLPFSAVPLKTINKFKINAGTRALVNSVGSTVLPDLKLDDINIAEVQEKLRRIRTH